MNRGEGVVIINYYKTLSKTGRTIYTEFQRYRSGEGLFDKSRVP